MTPVTGPLVTEFVEKGLFKNGRKFGANFPLGFESDEGLVAGFVFHNWDPDNGTIEVSGYSTKRDWVNKALLRVLFDYPFRQAGCRAVVARHSEHNSRVIRIWKALGATQTRVPELRGPNEAEVIAVLTKEAWLSSKFMR